MFTRKLLITLYIFCIPALILTGSCKQETEKAICELVNTEGEDVGVVKMAQLDERVVLDVVIRDLAPGLHAMHIHENGDFTPPDFVKAGGHFNPFDKEHGFHNKKGHHAGDLPNINVESNRKCRTRITVDYITLKERKKNSLFRNGGTSIIIHEKPDDYVSNPAGDAGRRIAGGIIKKL